MRCTRGHLALAFTGYPAPKRKAKEYQPCLHKLYLDKFTKFVLFKNHSLFDLLRFKIEILFLYKKTTDLTKKIDQLLIA